MSRNKDYSAEELESLVYNMELRPDLVFGNRDYESYAQTTVWEKIAEVVSAVGQKRSGLEVKKKWYNLKWHTRDKAKKIQEYKKMFGENSTCPFPLSAIEKRVLEFLEKTSCEGSIPSLHENQLVPSTSECSLDVPSSSASKANIENVVLHSAVVGGTRVLLVPVTVKNTEDSECVEETNNTIQEPNPNVTARSNSIEISRMNIVENFLQNEKNRGCSRKRKLQNPGEDVLKNVCEMFQELNEVQEQQTTEIKEIGSILLRLVKLKEAKLKMKCTKYGLNFQAVVD